MVGEDDKGWDNGKWGGDKGLSVTMSKLAYQLAARYTVQQQNWGNLLENYQKTGFYKTHLNYQSSNHINISTYSYY